MSGFERSVRTSSVTRWTAPGRRVAVALAIPGAFAGLLLAGSPASAATPRTSGICNGVVSQLADGGSVQENLIKAAARQNAELIAALTAERTALQEQGVELQARIDQISLQLADLEAEGIELDASLKTRHLTLDLVMAQQASVADQISALEKELAALQEQRSKLQAQLDALDPQVTPGEAALLTQLNELNDEISAIEAQLATLRGQLTSLDVQVTAAQEAVRDLEAQIKANTDAIASLNETMQDLQGELRGVHDQIRAIDGTIALGGCTA